MTNKLKDNQMFLDFFSNYVIVMSTHLKHNLTKFQWLCIMHLPI